MVWALAIGAAGLAWLLFGRQAGPGDAAVDDQQIARDIRTATSAKLAQSRMAESAGAAALGGAALGGAIAGPIGAFVGGMVAGWFGGLLQSMGEPTYGEAVRTAIKDSNRRSGYDTSAAAIDAMVFRNALLGAEHVWRREADGALAFEILATGDGFRTSLSRGGPGFIPGQAASQAQQSILGVAPGMVDGPGRRKIRREWLARARAGDLFVIETTPAPRTWRTPGYVWFGSRWPYRAEHRSARAGDRGWTKIAPNEGNVDRLAARFDSAAGVRF